MPKQGWPLEALCCYYLPLYKLHPACQEQMVII